MRAGGGDHPSRRVAEARLDDDGPAETKSPQRGEGTERARRRRRLSLRLRADAGLAADKRHSAKRPGRAKRRTQRTRAK